MANPKKPIPGSKSEKEDVERIKKLRKESIDEIKKERIGNTKELSVILNKLNDKQKTYVEARVGGLLKKQAGRATSPDCKQPTGIATRMEKDPMVRQALALAFEEAGITPLALAYAFKGGLDAKKSFHNKTKDSLEKTELDDHKIQVESAKAIVDILGLRVPKEEQGDKHLHIHLSKKEADEMEEGVLAHLQEKFGKKT